MIKIALLIEISPPFYGTPFLSPVSFLLMGVAFFGIRISPLPMNLSFHIYQVPKLTLQWSSHASPSYRDGEHAAEQKFNINSDLSNSKVSVQHTAHGLRYFKLIAQPPLDLLGCCMHCTCTKQIRFGDLDSLAATTPT